MIRESETYVDLDGNIRHGRDIRHEEEDGNALVGMFWAALFELMAIGIGFFGYWLWRLL